MKYLTKTIFLIMIASMWIISSCNEPLPAPPETEVDPGHGPYQSHDFVPYWHNYIEKEPALVDGLDLKPQPSVGTNDDRLRAERIGVNPNGEEEGPVNVMPEENGSIISIKGWISGLAGTDYNDPSNPLTFVQQEMRFHPHTLTCLSIDAGSSDELSASPDDYYVVESGVHFRNRWKSNGIYAELQWFGTGDKEKDPDKETGQATLATYTCDRDAGVWNYQSKEEDRDINLDLYIYKLTPEGDIEARCETEGWRRHPEHCSDHPDIFVGPWDHFTYYFRVAMYGDEHTWRIDEEGVASIVYDVEYNLTIHVE